MAPSGADVSIHEMSSSLSSPASTAFLFARDVSLTTDEGVLMTHLVVWLLTFLSALFFGLRLGAKCFRRAGLAVDDALLAAAWAAVLFYSVIASLELALGLGTDNSSSSPSTSSPPSSLSSSQSSSSSSSSNTNAEALILLDHVARTFCLTAAAWSKSAVAVILLKVPSRGNPGSSKPWTPVMHGVLFGFIAVVNTGLAAAIIAHWFRCAPITKEWDSSVDGSCWSMTMQGAISIAAQSFSGAMDVALVAIGLLLVWGLGLSVGGKAGALGLSFLGIVASAASITTAVEIATLTDSNSTSANLRILLAASIETPLVIITASLPSLRLFNKNYSPSSSPHSFGAAYLKHKNGDSKTSTTIRLLPASGGTISPHDAPPPSTSQSSVFPGPSTTPLRGKASFSSSISGGGGGIVPARPPRPASVEAGVGPGMFWADPTAPAALSGGTAGSVRSATGTTTTVTARGQQASTNHGRPGDESSRGLLLSPGEGAFPSPYTLGLGVSSSTSPAPTSAAPMISPYNNHPSNPPYLHAYHNDSPSNNDNNNNNNNRNNFNNQPTIDAFDTYYDANFPAGLVAPRVLTPLEEEDGHDFNSRASSYRSSAISESTMTNSHWLDIPVPQPDNDGGSSRRESSKFSMSGFLDSYGPRAASVLRKMDLIVPLGTGDGVAQQQQQQQYHQGHADGSATTGLNFGKAGNRDSPTLGDYWGSMPSSPAATAAPATATTAVAGFRNITGGGGGMARHPWQQHLKDYSMSSYTSYSNTINNNNRF